MKFMQDRTQLLSNSPVDTTMSLDEFFTEAENDVIREIIKGVDKNDEAKEKEWEACQAKLVIAEQEIIRLQYQLGKVSQQFVDEKSRAMLLHKQMVDLYNKVKDVEGENRTAQSQIQCLTKALDVPGLIPAGDNKHSSPFELEVVVEEVPSSAPSEGLRRRSLHSGMDTQASFFRNKAHIGWRSQHENEEERHYKNSCVESETCLIM